MSDCHLGDLREVYLLPSLALSRKLVCSVQRSVGRTVVGCQPSPLVQWTDRCGALPEDATHFAFLYTQLMSWLTASKLQYYGPPSQHQLLSLCKVSNTLQTVRCVLFGLDENVDMAHQLRYDTLLYFFRLVSELLQPKLCVSMRQAASIALTQFLCFPTATGC